jgi:hypothetical protein
MALLNGKIRTIYAGALGALGIAVGAAFGSVSDRSSDDPSRSGTDLAQGGS